MEFTTQLIEKNMEVCIKIKINENFNFNFNNVKNTPTFPARKKSPSQVKRNYLRQKDFENKVKENLPDVKKEMIDKRVKHEETQTKESSFETKFAQTEVDVGINSQTVETQTSSIKTNAETQTETKDSKPEESIVVNEKGEIHPGRDQTILEFRISHDFKSWDEVKEEIYESFKFKLIGNPWLANNGHNFKTVAFVTDKRDFENWKSKTLNSDNGILRPVNFSKPYK